MPGMKLPYRETAMAIIVLAILGGAAGCRVKVDKSSNGEDGNVKIATPFGGIDINKDQATPSDVGLPAYPGAVLETDDDGHRSAKVDLGFGPWKLRVRAINYSTADSRDKVLTFYRQALSAYGGVIECAGDKTIGPARTSAEGLSCDHSDKDHSIPQANLGADDVELKAGSPRHQHLVVLHPGSATRFTLVAVDLPHITNDEQRETN